MHCKLSIVLDVIIEKGPAWLNQTGCLFKATLLHTDLMMGRDRERKRDSYIMTGIHNGARVSDDILKHLRQTLFLLSHYSFTTGKHGGPK